MKPTITRPDVGLCLLIPAPDWPSGARLILTYMKLNNRTGSMSIATRHVKSFYQAAQWMNANKDKAFTPAHVSEQPRTKIRS
jgi:hypothetical protein